MTFQLKYSIYNPDPFQAAIKAKLGGIQIIIMNAITPFIYINITTIEKNTGRKEGDTSCCTDDSFWGCCWGIQYNAKWLFQNVSFGIRKPTILSMLHELCVVWDECLLWRLGTAAGIWRLCGRSEVMCVSDSRGCAHCILQNMADMFQNAEVSLGESQEAALGSSNLACDFQCRNIVYCSPQRLCSKLCWTPLLLHNWFPGGHHGFFVSIVRTFRNWPSYWLPFDPVLPSAIT